MINIQPGSSSRPKKSTLRTPQENSRVQFVSWITTLFNAALLVGVIATAFHTYISLHQQMSETERESARVQKEIDAVEREIAQQRNLYAARTSERYLMAQIRRFNLPLVAPEDGQLRRMTLLSPSQAARVASPSLIGARRVAVSKVPVKNRKRTR